MARENTRKEEKLLIESVAQMSLVVSRSHANYRHTNRDPPTIPKESLEHLAQTGELLVWDICFNVIKFVCLFVIESNRADISLDCNLLWTIEVVASLVCFRTELFE